MSLCSPSVRDNHSYVHRALDAFCASSTVVLCVTNQMLLYDVARVIRLTLILGNNRNGDPEEVLNQTQTRKRAHRGGVVQVETRVESAWSQRVKLTYDKRLSKFEFNVNLRP